MAKGILIVDDTPELAENLADILRMEGFEVTVTDNGQAALEALSSAKELPDLVITDLVMPKMNGLDLVRGIRNLPAGADLPVIILTANAMEESSREGLAAGANLYLKKPCEIDYLLTSINTLIKND
jgi:DNA-binding response OmpR family regulator